MNINSNLGILYRDLSKVDKKMSMKIEAIIQTHDEKRVLCSRLKKIPEYPKALIFHIKRLINL